MKLTDYQKSVFAAKRAVYAAIAATATHRETPDGISMRVQGATLAIDIVSNGRGRQVRVSVGALAATGSQEEAAALGSIAEAVSMLDRDVIRDSLPDGATEAEMEAASVSRWSS